MCFSHYAQDPPSKPRSKPERRRCVLTAQQVLTTCNSAERPFFASPRLKSSCLSLLGVTAHTGTVGPVPAVWERGLAGRCSKVSPAGGRAGK